MRGRGAGVYVPPDGSQVGDDLSQQKIAIAKFFTYALEFILRRHHFLDVAYAIVVVANGTDVTAGFDNSVYEGRDVACLHGSVACHFVGLSSRVCSRNMAITACAHNLCDYTGCEPQPEQNSSAGTSDCICRIHAYPAAAHVSTRWRLALRRATPSRTSVGMATENAEARDRHSKRKRSSWIPMPL